MYARLVNRSLVKGSATRSWAKVKVRHERVFLVGGIRMVDAFDGALVARRPMAVPAGSWSG